MSVKTLFLDGDNKQLRDAIFNATPKSIEQCRVIAQKFKGKDDLQTCKNIWNFLKNDVTYVVDGEHQKIKLPSALLRERTGDCKSYSLFTAGILGNLGIPFKYALTSYTSDPTPAHIYVKCDNGIIIDAVWTAFNEEKKPNHIYYQKPNMKISYIAGINAPVSNSRPSAIGYAPMGSVIIKGYRNGMYRKPLGTTKTFMGIGRTGLDWAAAIGKPQSTYDSAAYWTKKATLLVMREVVLALIRNNGGGIANFLYNAWLRTEPYYLPNQKKWDAEYNAGLSAIDKQFPLPYKTFPFTAAETAALNSSYTPTASGGALNILQKVQTAATKSVSQVLSPQRLAEYNKFQSILTQRQNATKQLTTDLEIKYPVKTRLIAPSTAKSQAKYRDIEWWFFKQGGSPDDFNDAVKEGNTKSPRGKDANYMLMKAFKGELSVKDIGLITRAVVSVYGGDKFGLGDEGTFVIGIGCVDVATCTAAVTAYIAPITGAVLSITGLLAAAGIEIDIPALLNGEKQPQTPNPNPPLFDDKDVIEEDNTLLIVGGVGIALVGAYFLLKK